MARRIHREPMSNVDTAWYRMEDPTNLMMVNIILRLDGNPEYEALRELFHTRLLYFKRFRQRVVAKPGVFGGLFWEEDPDLDVDRHLKEIELGEPGTQQQLEELVSREMGTPLDYNHPLWQILIIRGVEGDTALLLKIHHCIADGSALLRVLLSLAREIDPSEEDETKSEGGDYSRERDTDYNSGSGLKSTGFWSSLFKPVAQLGKGAARIGDAVARGTIETIRRPSNLIHSIQLPVQSFTSLGRLLLRRPDPSTILKGKLGRQKVATWSNPYPLDEIKEIKEATQSTVNDVMVTVFAGAVRRYLIAGNESVDDLNIRAAVPVDLRKEMSGSELGNKFGLVFLSLPVGIGDVLERLEEQKARMARLKDSPEAGVVLGVLSGVGMAPEEIEDAVVRLIGSKTTLVMTNVRGPENRLSLVGYPLKEIMFWVPQSGKVGLGVSVISYNNQVRVGIATDEGLIPDPKVLLSGMDEEIKELKERIKI